MFASLKIMKNKQYGNQKKSEVLNVNLKIPGLK